MHNSPNNKIHTNIAVIGAGITGTVMAYYLQQQGDTTVTVFDKDAPPFQNASAMAGGMLAPLSELDHMPPMFLPAAEAGVVAWAEISAALHHRIGFEQRGSLILAHRHDRHSLERFVSLLPLDLKGLDWDRVNAAGVAALEPMIQGEMSQTALYMMNEAHLDPAKVSAAMSGALKMVQQDVTPPSLTAQGFDAIIDCRGIGARDDRPDLRGVKGEVVYVRNPDFTLSRPVRLMHPRYPLYIVPRDDHVFMIGATVIESEACAHVSLRAAMELLSALYSLHPSFGDADILDIKAGTRPSYTDNMPRIDIDGDVIHCNGMFRHGYLFAPIMAQCVVDHIHGRENDYSPLFVKQRR